MYLSEAPKTNTSPDVNLRSMISFFRRIRKGLFTDSKFGKYLLYALGEIILVVMGILIALYINNWNQKQQQQHVLQGQYQRILNELNIVSNELESRAAVIDTMINARNTQLLTILKSGQPDSLRANAQLLSAVPNVIAISVELPITKSFVSADTPLGTEDEALKVELLKLLNVQSFSETLEDYSKEQLQNIIEPYLLKHLNYAQLVQDPNMVVVHPVEDYAPLMKDRTFENIVNIKLEIDHAKVQHLNQLITFMRDLSDRISGILTQQK